MKDFDFQIGIIKNKNSDSLDIDIFYQTDKWDFTKKSINISNNEVKKNKNLYLIDISNLSGIDIIKKVAKTVRTAVEDNIGTGTQLSGYCILISELIATILKDLGFNATTVEGWCSYDDPYYGSSRSYDEHTWVEVDDLYIDVSADQFNAGMDYDNKYPDIIIQKGLPHNMSYEEPEEED